MPVHDGIDSAYFAWNNLDNVQRAYGKKPAFWGRYLPDDAITQEEVAWFHAQSISVLPIWNGESAATVGWGYDYAHGQALVACAAWRALGLPTGCAILVDVEQLWEVSGAFLQGWLDGCFSQGYRGGAYLNILSGVNHVAAWLWAREQTSSPGVVYTSEPELTEWRGTVRTDWYDFTQTPIAPRAADVVFHQYSEQEGAVDLDVASDDGYALCWGAVLPAPPVQIWRVVTPGTLKVAPNHSSDAAVDPHHNPVYLEVGAQVQPVDKPTHTDDEWQEVDLVKPEQVVHGWLLANSIKAGTA